MKRSPLIRKTPLARTGPIRRAWIAPSKPSRPKARPPEDRVTPELHRHVVERDKACFLWTLDHDHQCRRLGIPHSPFALDLLSVDHFWLDGGHTGDRAPSDGRHLVAMCLDGNTGNPSHKVRQAERDYTADLELKGTL